MKRKDEAGAGVGPVVMPGYFFLMVSWPLSQKQPLCSIFILEPSSGLKLQCCLIGYKTCISTETLRFVVLAEWFVLNAKRAGHVKLNIKLCYYILIIILFVMLRVLFKWYKTLNFIATTCPWHRLWCFDEKLNIKFCYYNWVTCFLHHIGSLETHYSS